jgi:D-alanyl-D-alanine dipeptidase
VQRALRRQGLSLLILDAYRPVRATEALVGGFAFGPSSHTYNASGRILRNRLTLKNAMERFHFGAYLNEWWHFEHVIRPNRYLDVTLGC